MQIKFKESYDTQLTDEDGEFVQNINWKAGDVEECRTSDTYVSGVQLEFPDGTIADNVPNRVFEVIKQ